MFARILLCLLILCVVGFDAYGFEVISSKTTVSPGYEGGVLNEEFTTLPLLKKVQVVE